MTYSVNFWGSKPFTNDDCWNGSDFETLADALACFNALVTDSSTAYVEINGPDVHKERRNPGFVPISTSDDDWTREIQREHLMLHGSLDA